MPESKKTETRLTGFVEALKRRLVEDVLLLGKEQEISPAPRINEGGNVSIRTKFSTTVSLPFRWLAGHMHRVYAMQDLDVDPIPLIVSDLLGSLTTAAKVVLTLWSPVHSMFGLSYEENLTQLLDTALWYVPMCGEEQEFIPYLKYQLSYLFAKAENQLELPERPGWIRHNDGLVILGSLGRFFHARLFGRSMKNREFRNTVLQGVKKGMPQMGSFHLKKNLEAMKKRLTKVNVTPNCLLDEVSRTTREIYPRGVSYESYQHAQAWIGVSDHASYERTRSEGGVLHMLRDLDQGNSLHRFILPDQLCSMYWDPTNALAKELRWPDWLPDEVYNSVQRFSVLTSSRRGGAAKAKPIFEPFKVRMISAGDILSNGVFGNLQKILWKGLQRFDQFSLTGKSVQSEDLRELERRSLFTLGGKFKYWVSGDYSAATDNLNSDATRAVIDSLSNDPMTRAVLTRGLQDTTIDFSSIKLDDVPEPFKMTNGQLMGCVFSFPILCIINLAVYRASLEAETGQRYKIAELPVLVNGDDIMFKTNKSLLRTWEGLIRRVGFEKSVGKNYVSSEFAMINSTYFSTTNNKSGLSDIQKVPYLNIGWCTGVSKGGSGSMLKNDDEEEKSILRIRSQVEKTRSDWLIDQDYRSDKHMERRAEVIERFKEEILLWNWDRIVESYVSVGNGPAGLGLRDEVEPVWDAFSYFLYNEKEKRTQHGISSQPKSMAPWKITKSDPTIDDFRPLFTKFNRAGGVKLWERHAQRYLERGFNSIRVEFEETRYVVGEFHKTSPGLGRPLDIAQVEQLGDYDSEYYDRINFFVQAVEMLLE